MMKLKILLGCLLVSVVTLPIFAQSGDDWERQLKQAKEATYSEDSIPKLMSYTYKGKIESDAKVKQVKGMLLSEDNYFPVEEGKAMYTMKTMKEFKEEKPEDARTIVKGLSDYIDKSVQKGQSLVELTWKLRGKQYKSLCVVSDNLGIVYDNIIMNVMLQH